MSSPYLLFKCSVVELSPLFSGNAINMSATMQHFSPIEWNYTQQNVKLSNFLFNTRGVYIQLKLFLLNN